MSSVYGVLGWQVKRDNRLLYLLFASTTTSLKLSIMTQPRLKNAQIHWRRGMGRRSVSKPVFCNFMAVSRLSRPTRRRAKEVCRTCGGQTEGLVVTMLSIRDVVSCTSDKAASSDSRACVTKRRSIPLRTWLCKESSAIVWRLVMREAGTT